MTRKQSKIEGEAQKSPPKTDRAKAPPLPAKAPVLKSTPPTTAQARPVDSKGEPRTGREPAAKRAAGAASGPPVSIGVRELLGRVAARASLLGDAAAVVSARAAEIEALSARREHVLAVLGDGTARTRLLHRLLGVTLLPEQRLDLPGTLVTFRRSAQSDYLARLADGAMEQFSRLPPAGDARGDSATADGERDAQQRRAARAATATDLERARSDAALHHEAAAKAALALPAFLRGHPAPWALWIWLLRFLLAPFHSAARAAYGQAQRRLEAATGKVGELERTAAGWTGARTEPGQQFCEALAALTDMRARGSNVRELDIDVVSAALPAGLVLLVVSVTGDHEQRERALSRVRESDGWIADSVLPPEFAAELRERGLAHVPTEASALVALSSLEKCRAQRIATLGNDALRAAAAALAAQEERALSSWRERIAAAEVLKVTDPGALVVEQLARCTGSITQRVHLALESATRQLGHELSVLQNDWSARLAAVPTVDELKQTLTRIDQEANDALHRVCDNVNIALGGVLGGAVRDLASEALAGLAPRFRALAINPPREASEPGPAVRVLDSLVRPGMTAILQPGLLASLFRPLNTLRSEANASLTERVAALQAACTDEVLEAEPAITAHLRTSMERLCRDAVTRLASAADVHLSAERADIEREKAALAPIVALRKEVEASVIRLA